MKASLGRVSNASMQGCLATWYSEAGQIKISTYLCNTFAFSSTRVDVRGPPTKIWYADRLVSSSYLQCFITRTTNPVHSINLYLKLVKAWPFYSLPDSVRVGKSSQEEVRWERGVGCWEFQGWEVRRWWNQVWGLVYTDVLLKTPWLLFSLLWLWS